MAWLSSACFMLARFVAEKMATSLRLVMIKVLEGGVGSDSCGRLLRSRESDECLRFAGDEAVEL